MTSRTRCALSVVARRGAWLALLFSVSASALAACGGGDEACTTLGCQTAAPAATGTGGAGGSGGGANVFDDFESGGGTGALGEDDACRQVTFSAQSSPVNVHILLDRSTSMLELADPAVPGVSRWDAVTAGLRAFVNSAQAADARVGLQFFGLTNGNDDCAIDKYRTPAVPIAPLEANRAALLAAIDGTLPGSLTPTAPAVAGALDYARQIAELPENAEVPTVMILASDGIPSECGPLGPDGMMITSFREIIDTLERFSQPERDAMDNPLRPPVLTYIIGTEELRNNAEALAEAGGGQAFLVDGQSTSGQTLEQRFLDALLTIVVKPLDCEIEVPQTAPDTGEMIDFDKVRVRFTGASSGVTTEFPRTDGPGGCGVSSAWFYDNPAAPQKILFCRNACESLGAGDLSLELGCSPQLIVQ